MVKELFQQTLIETALNVSQSRIEAVMKKKITKSGCRVYKDGFLGIAGTLGEAKDKTWTEAESNLSKKISYPFEPEKNRKRIRDLRAQTISEQDFVKEMEELLHILHQEYPDFIFSNKIKLIESEILLRNDTGLDYINYDRSIELGLLVKHVDSVSIFDTGIFYSSRSLEADKILREARQVLEGFKKEITLPQQEKMLVVIHQSVLLSKVIESLNGENVGLGTSLFCDNMGTRAFDDSFSVYQDRTEEKQHTPFFDMEGVVNSEDQVMLIDEGVILKAYTDKKQSATFSFPVTGSAGGGYDDVPSLGYADLSILPGEKTLTELLQGEYGVMVIMASGGDYSSEGNFASPVQMAYLTDGEQLLGRLPELNISGNMYDIFGEDFVGVSKDKPLMGERALVVRMKIG
ncbi:MAG: hypothetical protein APF84_08960 [Gracilibacter sp. BRH_c7a]|nr:MAG: hypothetical protein APF84_08960 [Gracilibacter sp. BRH_c7a]